MIHINSPKTDNESLWHLIVSNKHAETQAVLLKNQNAISSCYKYYQSNYKNLEKIKPRPHIWDGLEVYLLGCYGNNKFFNAEKQQLLDNLPDAVKNKCPYCMINEHNTLDYYFDKSTYPEYSVFFQT